MHHTICAHISIALHSGSMMYHIVAAVDEGGTVIVRQYHGSEDRLKRYNQWIHELFYHSTKVQVQ